MGGADAQLLDQVQKAWSRSRPRPKRLHAAAHDAGLMAAIEHVRAKGERAWVLTEDMTMCVLASERAGPHGIPGWISSYAVIEILAVDGAGPAMTAEDAGGLIAAMFENDLHPVAGTYTLEDLDWLVSIDARAGELDQETLDAVATSIARARLAGRSKDDSDFVLEVNRALQRGRSHLESQRDSAIAELSGTLEDLRSERDLRSRAETALRDRDVRAARTKARVVLSLRLTTVLAVGVLALWAGASLVEYGARANDVVAMSFGTFLLPFAVSSVPLEVARTIRGFRGAMAATAFIGAGPR